MASEERKEKARLALRAWRLKNGHKPRVKLSDEEKKERARIALAKWRLSKGMKPREKKLSPPKVARVKLTEEEKKARAKAAQEAWRRKQGIRPRVKLSDEERKERARIARGVKPKIKVVKVVKIKVVKAKPEKLSVARVVKTEAEKIAARREAQKRARAKKPARVLLTVAEKKARLRVLQLAARSRNTRTPEGLMKLLMRLKWAVKQDMHGHWIVVPWVHQAMSYFPVKEVCAWMERMGVGVKIVNGTVLEFRFDRRFDISGDYMSITCGHKRVRNLEGLVSLLEAAQIPVPKQWASIDTAPDTYRWADCLRNMLGHDLTRVRTALGAKSKRFPTTLNLAAIEEWMRKNDIMGWLTCKVQMRESGSFWVKLSIKQTMIWHSNFSDEGAFPEGAIESAVDVLKKLPTTRWDNSDYVTPEHEKGDPYLNFDPLFYKTLRFPLSLGGMMDGALRFCANEQTAHREVWSWIDNRYVVKREDGLYVPSGLDKTWNEGYMDVIEPFID